MTRCDVLVIECQSAKLQAQKLGLASKISAAAMLAEAAGWQVRVLETEDAGDLTWQLGKFMDQFPSGASRVALIGHSNCDGWALGDSGIRAGTTRWKTLAGSWLKPIRPEEIVLIGCEAGSYAAADALFAEIPSLRDVLGSPLLLNATSGLVALLSTLGSGLLGDERPEIGNLQVASLLVGNVFWRRSRDGVTSDPLVGKGAAVIEDVIRCALSPRHRLEGEQQSLQRSLVDLGLAAAKELINDILKERRSDP